MTNTCAGPTTLRVQSPMTLRGLYPIVDLALTADPLGLLAAVLPHAAIVQLRAKGVDDGALLALAMAMADRCQAAGVPFVVNDAVDVAWAAGCGVHLGQQDLPVEVARRLLGPDAVIGVSTNTIDEARRAVAGGASYVAVGAMFATTTKTDTRPAGLARLREIRAAVGVPLAAIGGIDETNAASVLAAGADLLAVIGAIGRAADPAAVAARLAATRST